MIKLNEFGIGGAVKKSHTEKINGQDVRVITGFDLLEISVLDQPMPKLAQSDSSSGAGSLS